MEETASEGCIAEACLSTLGQPSGGISLVLGPAEIVLVAALAPRQVPSHIIRRSHFF